MTRKHFKAIAEAISRIKDEGDRCDVAYRIARVCATSNPRFNFSKFMEACNAEEN